MPVPTQATTRPACSAVDQWPHWRRRAPMSRRTGGTCIWQPTTAMPPSPGSRPPGGTPGAVAHRRARPRSDGDRDRPGRRPVRALAGRQSPRLRAGERAGNADPQRPGHRRPGAGPALLRRGLRLHPGRQPGSARMATSPSCGDRTGTRSAASWAFPVRRSMWQTTFEVADTDAVLERAPAHGGRAGEPDDFVYGRMAQVTDPFGAEFSVITRPWPGPGLDPSRLPIPDGRALGMRCRRRAAVRRGTRR